VHELHTQLNASTTRIGQIREETAKDTVLAVLRDTIALGWPETRSDCPEILHGYWNYRDELGVEDGIILKGSRIVIPQSLRADVLAKLHYAHQGVEKCRLRAKSSVFWDGINKDIEQTVGTCAQCQTHQPSATKEPLMPHDVPPRSWHTLCSDLFYWEQNHYLLIADLYSKFPIVRKLGTLSSRSVINHMKGIFDEHGIPDRLISDNGTQYSSEEFKQFAATYGFEHVTSSPLYPRSNGFAERMVQTIKHLFTKAREGGQDPHMAMLCLRTTPLDHQTPSPSELLNGRKYRSNIPTTTVAKLKESPASYTDNLQHRQNLQKAYHDRDAKSLPPLHPQEHVRVQDPGSKSKSWAPGQITQVLNAPRSYKVQTSSGIYRRNRRHLRQTRESFHPATFTESKVDDEDNAHATSSTAKLATPNADPGEPRHDIVTSYGGVPPPAPPLERSVDTGPPVTLRRSSRVPKPPAKLNL